MAALSLVECEVAGPAQDVEHVEGQIRSRLWQKDQVHARDAEELLELTRQLDAVVNVQMAMRAWKSTQVDIGATRRVKGAVASHERGHFGP